MKKLLFLFIAILISLSSFGQITIGALTTTPISQSGNDKIPTSTGNDAATTVNNLSNWITRYVVIPVEYNSAVNQASVIQAAHDAATAGETLCMLAPGIVKSETQVTWTKAVKIMLGYGTQWKTTSNIIILVVSSATADGFQIEGGSFVGNDTGAAQAGLLLSSVSAARVVRVNFIDLNLYGARVTGGSNASPYETNTFLNCNAYSIPGIGFETLVTGEYVSFPNSSAWSCGTAIKLAGGNIDLTGFRGNACTNGILIDTGTNNGHSSVLGGSFNHCTTPVNYNDVEETGTNPLSVMFIGLQVHTGTILINDDLPFFVGCYIAAGTITITNCSRVVFSGCRIKSGITINGANAANAVYPGSYKDDGSAAP